MERNVKLIIAYDGTNFHGWQTQPGVRTVQHELETVARRLLGHPLSVLGASRTDAGVHARGQTAHLHTLSPMPVQNLQRALAARLPPDVAVVHAEQVAPEFHATRDAQGKLYRYAIYNRTCPPAAQLAAPYVWHVWHRLDLERMRAAAAVLVGSHDFSAFANQGSRRESQRRCIHRVGIWRRYEQVYIDVEGDGFLYNQVRIIVGTLVEVGRGHWEPERIAAALRSQDRRQAGPTAPAQGLCLQWVRYRPARSVADGA